MAISSGTTESVVPQALYCIKDYAKRASPLPPKDTCPITTIHCRRAPSLRTHAFSLEGVWMNGPEITVRAFLQEAAVTSE